MSHQQNMEIHLKIKRSKKELEALENQEKEVSETKMCFGKYDEIYLVVVCYLRWNVLFTAECERDSKVTRTEKKKTPPTAAAS